MLLIVTKPKDVDQFLILFVPEWIVFVAMCLFDNICLIIFVFASMCAYQVIICLNMFGLPRAQNTKKSCQAAVVETRRPAHQFER